MSAFCIVVLDAGRSIAVGTFSPAGSLSVIVIGCLLPLTPRRRGCSTTTTISAFAAGRRDCVGAASELSCHQRRAASAGARRSARRRSSARRAAHAAASMRGRQLARGAPFIATRCVIAAPCAWWLLACLRLGAFLRLVLRRRRACGPAFRSAFACFLDAMLSCGRPSAPWRASARASAAWRAVCVVLASCACRCGGGWTRLPGPENVALAGGSGGVCCGGRRRPAGFGCRSDPAAAVRAASGTASSRADARVVDVEGRVGVLRRAAARR